MSSQLAWQQVLSWKALKTAQEQCYWIEYPGLNVLAPSYHTYRGLPTDSSCTAVKSGTLTVLGDYPTLAAAQSACQTDAYPPGSYFKQPPPNFPA